MKPYLEMLIAEAKSDMDGRSIVREYLQARILQSLQRAGASIPLAFHGGTALRFLYNIPRYSEDLDFALERQRDLYDFRHYLATIQSDLETENYAITIKLNNKKVVHSALIRFRGLWHELGLSSHQTAVLTIKLEVDTNPPSGATVTTTQIKRYVPLHWQHHDCGSLLAGKVHAILQRPCTKGRDWYDLVWYLTHPKPPQLNTTMLNHALTQSGWSGEAMTADNWRDHVAKRCQQLDWAQVTADVTPFIIEDENHNGQLFLEQQQVLQLLFN